MSRPAEDDFAALRTAQGMENAGAQVFSIAYNGQGTHYGALAPHSRYIVFAKIKSDDMIDAVDAAIEKEMA